MLPPETVVINGTISMITKRDIIALVHALFVMECNCTVIANENVKKALAEQLIDNVLNPK